MRVVCFCPIYSVRHATCTTFGVEFSMWAHQTSWGWSHKRFFSLLSANTGTKNDTGQHRTQEKKQTKQKLLEILDTTKHGARNQLQAACWLFHPRVARTQQIRLLQYTTPRHDCTKKNEVRVYCSRVMGTAPGYNTIARSLVPKVYMKTTLTMNIVIADQNKTAPLFCKTAEYLTQPKQFFLSNFPRLGNTDHSKVTCILICCCSWRAGTPQHISSFRFPTAVPAYHMRDHSEMARSLQLYCCTWSPSRPPSSQ